MLESEQEHAVPPASIDLPRQIWTSQAGESVGIRRLAEETPIALVHNASTTAVMMATPDDLEDFAIGFSLSEKIIDHIEDVQSIDIVTGRDGIEARIWLNKPVGARMALRRRRLVGPTGCGLCGVDSLSEAMILPLSLAASDASIDAEAIIAAFHDLKSQQILSAHTRAVHAAAVWANGHLQALREDVGRHNALDKLIGAAARQTIDVQSSALLLTSRVSIEMVQKAAVLGAPIICAVSAPTGLAVRMAQAIGVTLVAVVRDDGFEIFRRADRIKL